MLSRQLIARISPLFCFHPPIPFSSTNHYTSYLLRGQIAFCHTRTNPTDTQKASETQKTSEAQKTSGTQQNPPESEANHR